MELVIKSSDVVINGTTINEKVFDEEMVWYRPLYTKDHIDNLIMWASECKCDTQKEMMKEDLKTLLNSDSEYILSSIGDNGFAREVEDSEEFNKICQEILEANEEI